MWIDERCKQRFRYFRLIAKASGLMFALGAVLIFMIQYLPAHAGRPVLIIFIIGSLLWALDTLWSTLDDCRALTKEIREHRS